jgi:hypothetical protein
MGVPRTVHKRGSPVMLPQAYLPKAYTWQRRSIQAATVLHLEMCAFLAAHPKVKVYSGLRIGDAGDHRCGFALDLVPVDGATTSGYAAIKAAFADAVKRGYPYVEPLTQTWIPGNHHLHVSWRRCPR